MLRIALITITVLVTGLGILYLTGPRVSVDTTIRFDASQIGSDVEDWLARHEEAVPGLRPGLASEIVWAYPQSRAKTPLSIVYIHGFSASKGELRPVPDMVAEAVGANVFYARLTGHGQDGPAIARASVNDWINDYAAAIAVGRLIGERVIVVATSTGGALATWAATQPSLSADVAGMVLISPNYRIQGRGAALLTMPWGELIAGMVIGKERVLTPANELHARYWTTSYPVAALSPMAAIAELAHGAPIEDIRIPALFIFSDGDPVVRPELTHGIAERWRASHEMMLLEATSAGSNHVIAGDAFSPQNNTLVAGRIEEWIRTLSP